MEVEMEVEMGGGIEATRLLLLDISPAGCNGSHSQPTDSTALTCLFRSKSASRVCKICRYRRAGLPDCWMLGARSDV
jgi:hypothetical protein